MEIWIHAGLNKTGSSSLQLLLERNAAFLQAQGISYAKSQAGSGNATQICFALRRGNLTAVRKELRVRRRLAGATGCRRVLLSSELLYHDIADHERRAALLDQIRAAGFDQPRLMLFFRNPVGHAISCFCHRSGVRDIHDFEHWIAEQYEFPAELRRFLEAVDAGLGMALTARPYSARNLPGELCRWLDIDALPVPLDERVNRSVNAFEARLLSWLRQTNPSATERVRAQLKALDPALKRSDQALRAEWRRVAAAQLQPIADDLARLGALIGEPIGVEGGEPEAPDVPAPEPDEIRLSQAQLNAILGALRGPLWPDALRAGLSQLRRRLGIE